MGNRSWRFTSLLLMVPQGLKMENTWEQKMFTRGICLPNHCPECILLCWDKGRISNCLCSTLTGLERQSLMVLHAWGYRQPEKQRPMEVTRSLSHPAAVPCSVAVLICMLTGLSQHLQWDEFRVMQLWCFFPDFYNSFALLQCWKLVGS